MRGVIGRGRRSVKFRFGWSDLPYGLGGVGTVAEWLVWGWKAAGPVARRSLRPGVVRLSASGRSDEGAWLGSRRPGSRQYRRPAISESRRVAPRVGR